VKSGYYRLIRGSNVHSLVKDNVKEGDLRYISGDVLTGSQIVRRGYLGYYNNQITVIPEGNKFDFLGWASLGFGRFSVSRSYWSWLNKEKKYTLDTNLKGGRRAFVLTGIFNKVLPMDIFPVHLIKAIMIEDIDLMENLGIYEVAPEDFALCEFVDVSKIDIQKIIRHGLDLMKKETE
jgi:Na+-transporting NADH:ubiquinone oxidoreductase subunit A